LIRYCQKKYYEYTLPEAVKVRDERTFTAIAVTELLPDPKLIARVANSFNLVRVVTTRVRSVLSTLRVDGASEGGPGPGAG
jgi:hypothetical protein